MLGGKRWSDYLLTTTLRNEIFRKLQLKFGDNNLPVDGDMFRFVMNTEIGENGYRTGLGFLAGSNSDVGGIEIIGLVSYRYNKEGYASVEFHMSIVWNDIIDANYKELGDVILRPFVRGTDYKIQIYAHDVMGWEISPRYDDPNADFRSLDYILGVKKPPIPKLKPAGRGF